ncbi:DUF1552 domain-containing protein [Paraglaciecola sp.]|uniref:DUF1552 domain-containing protein n=1 Tax=Paraglaciecola sp. TaxID=1920173 RepID=UPI003EF6A425
MKNSRINRRTFLRGMGGIALSLPMLEIMASTKLETTQIPKRMACIGNWLGLVPDMFFPKTTGADYQLSPLLEPLAQLKDQFTVFSGLDHGEHAIGGHTGIHTLLSGIKSTRSKHYAQGNISVDQVAAAYSGANTRYPSIQLAIGKSDTNQLSWSSNGAPVPPIRQLHELFNLLFTQTNPKRFDALEKIQQDQISLLDLVQVDSKTLHKKASNTDKEKLDEYFTSIRELELQLTQSKTWIRKAKPEVDYSLRYGVDDLDFVDKVPLYYDLMALALATDSTRVMTFELSGIGKNLGGFNVTRGEHQLSHHGKVKDFLKELHIIEQFHTKQLARFIQKLADNQQLDGSSLLDHTMVLFGSGFGNANSHSLKKLPLLLAGGPFKHGSHLSYPTEKSTGHSMPASNLLLSMLQGFGVPTDSFNRSTSALTGFEFV